MKEPSIQYLLLDTGISIYLPVLMKLHSYFMTGDGSYCVTKIKDGVVSCERISSLSLHIESDKINLDKEYVQGSLTIGMVEEMIKRII